MPCQHLAEPTRVRAVDEDVEIGPPLEPLAEMLVALEGAVADPQAVEVVQELGERVDRPGGKVSSWACCDRSMGIATRLVPLGLARRVPGEPRQSLVRDPNVRG